MPTVVIQIEEVTPQPRTRRPWLSVQEAPPSPGADLHIFRPFVRPLDPPEFNPFPGRPNRRPFPAWTSPQGGNDGPPIPSLGNRRRYPFLEPSSKPLETEDLLRRITQKLSALINSLFLKGFIIQDGQGEWTLLPGVISATGPPTVEDDIRRGVYPGIQWVDTVGLQMYVNLVNTAHAAVWKQITT